MVHLSSLSPRRTRPSPDIPNLTKKDGSRFARWPTLATMKPSRRWGTQILDVGHPSRSRITKSRVGLRIDTSGPQSAVRKANETRKIRANRTVCCNHYFLHNL